MILIIIEPSKSENVTTGTLFEVGKNKIDVITKVGFMITSMLKPMFPRIGCKTKGKRHHHTQEGDNIIMVFSFTITSYYIQGWINKS